MVRNGPGSGWALFLVPFIYCCFLYRVSSASWYFLNVFGLRSMYTLLLGQDNGEIWGSGTGELCPLHDTHQHLFCFPAADQSRIMQDQMSGAALSVPPDTNKAFKAEWEAMEITEHHWALENIEEDLITQDLTLSPP
ncbi:hypothetical protein GDO86_014710 [Hymenochirus boettgeri]|uniref:Uncharacterized protein n=1 Tax=Hymenochirus boettgeri TaxID=247094 RepID=A0A8T2JTW8_9PIPI|nr:hypothetical protein GDO86_014710 [Hymenochirus boettgeri]